MQEKNNSIQREGLFYVAIGIASALIELLLFQGLYYFSPLGIIPSNVIAVLLATVFNFTLNRNVTFKSTTNTFRSLLLYTLLFIFNLCFSSLAIQALVNLGWHSAIAKILTQGCIVLWNFFLYRNVIFR